MVKQNIKTCQIVANSELTFGFVSIANAKTEKGLKHVKQGFPNYFRSTQKLFPCVYFLCATLESSSSSFLCLEGSRFPHPENFLEIPSVSSRSSQRLSYPGNFTAHATSTEACRELGFQLSDPIHVCTHTRTRSHTRITHMFDLCCDWTPVQEHYLFRGH